MYNLPGWPLWQPSLDAEDVHHVQDLHRMSKASWQLHTFPGRKKIQQQNESLLARLVMFYIATIEK